METGEAPIYAGVVNNSAPAMNNPNTVLEQYDFLLIAHR